MNKEFRKQLLGSNCLNKPQLLTPPLSHSFYPLLDVHTYVVQTVPSKSLVHPSTIRPARVLEIVNLLQLLVKVLNMTSGDDVPVFLDSY